MSHGKLAVLLCSCSLMFGQDFRATITGQVTDASGAAIAGAKVRAIQRSTNQASEATTNQDGYYTLTYLPPSTYDVEVSADGFEKAVSTNITLMVAEKRDLPFRLVPGNVRTEVRVTADVQEVQSADASGGLNFDALQTSEYPINGRQVYMLMDLTPGVQFTQENFGPNGYGGTRPWDTSNAYVMSGGVQGSNSFSLNGAPVSLTGTWQLSPNPDAVQEFKVMTNTYDAQIARSGGGSVNTTLKSGTNNWHGTMYEYVRNTVFDANSTQNNQADEPRGKHITNNFGGTAGGPLRKDRDFIFLSFDGYRERQPYPVIADVPPMDLRDGQHFSEYKMNIYDPLTVRPCGASDPAACMSNGGYMRAPFPGDVLPPSRMSPIGEKILSFYPAPNLPGLTQNFDLGGNTGRNRTDQPIGRWDHMIGSTDRLSATVTFQHGYSYRNRTGIPGPAASGTMWQQRTDQNYIANYTHIISGSALLDVRASFGRYTNYAPNADTSSGISTKDLGMTNMLQAPAASTNYPPRVTVDQFSNLFGNNANLYTWETDNQWNVAPSVSLTRGTQTIKTGVDLIYAGIGTGSIGLANGQFAFSRAGTQHYPLRAGGVSDGAGVAGLLMGVPGSGFVDWNDTFYRTWPYWGVFVQDDWRVTSSLTLNLGLRYDVQIPFKERWNRVNAGFDFNTVNPLSDQILAAWNTKKAAWDKANPTRPYYPAPPAAIMGGEAFIQPGGPRRIYQTDWTDIQPRIGLAWRFAPDTVLRAGFGIFYRTATEMGNTDGFSQQTTYNATPDGFTYNTPLTGPYSLADPYPDGLVSPSGSQLGLLTAMGDAVAFDGSQRVIPRTYQYSFGLQRMMPGQVRIDASYVGSITVHDTMNYNMDYVPLATYQAGNKTNAILNTSVPNPFFGILPKNSTFGASSTISALDLNFPYPEFNGVTMGTNPWGRWRYDALQLRAERRFLGSGSAAGSVTMVLAYSFSKAFDMSHRLVNWDLTQPAVHELTQFDKPQSVAFSGVWEVPFGKGRHFLTAPPKALSPVVSGWTVSWIYRYNSGYPVAGMNYQYTCSQSMLVSNQSHDHWFNNDPSCWSALPLYTIRNVQDRYPWLRQMDNSTLNAAMDKTFFLSERWRFTFRAEAFNVMNHPLYGAPDTNRTDARFGMLPLGQQNFPRYFQLSGKVGF